VIGRSSTCNLSLDDALVSRRHATITNKSDGVWVEDLGSRNGVVVNGTRIPGPTKLAHLDRVTVGSHDMVFVEVSDRGESMARCENCGTANAPGSLLCSKCGAAIHRGSPTLVGMTLSNIPGLAAMAAGSAPPPATAPRAEEETTAAQQLLTNIAEKALALGRYDEAERVLSRVLTDMLTRAKSGQAVQPGRLTDATKYALRLAEGTKKSQWIDWIFEVHEACGKLIGADEIEKLHECVRKVRYAGGATMRRYLEKMREKQADFGPSDRFLLQRLEGIQRVVSA
jgi:predicted component of type VI protein secretion system